MLEVKRKTALAHREAKAELNILAIDPAADAGSFPSVTSVHTSASSRFLSGTVLSRCCRDDGNSFVSHYPCLIGKRKLLFLDFSNGRGCFCPGWCLVMLHMLSWSTVYDDGKEGCCCVVPGVLSGMVGLRAGRWGKGGRFSWLLFCRHVSCLTGELMSQREFLFRGWSLRHESGRICHFACPCRRVGVIYPP